MTAMSQRLSEEAVRGIYPAQSIFAGQPIVPLGYRKDGRPIFPVMGGSPGSDDDDNDDSDEDDDEGGDADDDDSDDEDEDEGSPEGKESKQKKSKEGDRDPQRKIDALEDEKNRLYRGRQRARQERDDLQRQLEELKANGQGDDQLKTKVGELESTNKSLNEKLLKSRLQIAFLSDNSYEWQDPGLALRAADLSDVEIDDDGKVHGMKAALEALSTNSPFLLKQKERRRRTTEPTQRTGTPPKGKPSKQSDAERERIRQKYRIGR